MKKLLVISIFFCMGQTFAQNEIKISCDYELDDGESLSVNLRPYRDTPSGAHIKEFEIIVKEKSFKFSGEDFSLATMKWDDSNKLHLGALIKNSKYRLNFIHVGPADVRDYYSFLDVYEELGALKPGRYKPMGICRVL